MSDESHEGSSPLSYGEGPGVRSEKRCSKCGEIKPLDAFHKYRRNKDGVRSDCKACVALYRATNIEVFYEREAAYRAANAEAIRERSRTHYEANAEAILERGRARYAANAEAKLEQQAAYRAANAEAIRERRRAHFAAHSEEVRQKAQAYSNTRRDAINKRNRERYAADPEAHCERTRIYRTTHRDIYRAAKHRYDARKKGNGGEGFTSQQLLHMQLVQGGFCTYCQGHHLRLTIDHIIPVKQGGRHEAANICLACSKCNKSKNNRTPDQWLNRWYWDWRLREPEYIPPHWY